MHMHASSVPSDLGCSARCNVRLSTVVVVGAVAGCVYAVVYLTKEVQVGAFVQSVCSNFGRNELAANALRQSI